MARRQRAAQVRPDQSLKGRQFTAEVILWAVRWYLMFPISYRDLELRICTRNNRAFRVGPDNKGGVGLVSPCRADVLRRHLERRWFAAHIWIAMISRRLVAKTLMQ